MCYKLIFHIIDVYLDEKNLIDANDLGVMNILEFLIPLFSTILAVEFFNEINLQIDFLV